MQLKQLRLILGGDKELKALKEWNFYLFTKWRKMLNKQSSIARHLAVAERLVRGNLTVNMPPLPSNPYLLEVVEFLESIDGAISADAVPRGADRFIIESLYSAWQLLRLRLMIAEAAFGIVGNGVLLEPQPGDGVLASMAWERGVKYLGYAPDISLAAKIAPGAKLVKAFSACELRDEVDVVLLLEKAQWFLDPYGEIRCLAKNLKQGGYVLVAEPDISAAPAYAISLIYLGAAVLITKEHIHRYLEAAGLVPMERWEVVPPMRYPCGESRWKGG
ncbi:hypothetical protein [Pyrobaculum sp.]|uniref:hypothetical protein n=1 Tax=Pyrobaculum sp. TaxID=2004705 RepID=UPI00316F03D6